MGQGSHIETERKFTVPEGWSVPSPAGRGRLHRLGRPRRMTQTATYVDTSDLALLRSRRTLRRRTGGTDAGWHLKSPATGDARREDVAPLGAGVALVPPPLREAVADVVGAAALRPVAVLRTVRTRREVLAADGTVLALIEDDSVHARDLLTDAPEQAWREVEVEVVDGTDADLQDVTDALLESGAQVSASRSKLGQALSAAVAAVESPPAPTAGSVVLDYVAAQVGVLQASEPGVRSDLPDAVHKARVATRRLRATLRTFRPLFDRDVTDPLRRDIAWLTAALGAPRDAEVMRERLLTALSGVDADLVRGPVARRLERTLDRTHARAHADLVRALDSRRHRRLLADLTDLLVSPPTRAKASGAAADGALPTLVARAADAVSEAATRARTEADPDAREEAIHDIRKRAKAARYAAEAAGGGGRGAKAVVKAWEGVQELLGEHQDSVVARQVLESVYRDARRAGEDTFTYGVLIERERAAARAVEERYEAELLRAAAG